MCSCTAFDDSNTRNMPFTSMSRHCQKSDSMSSADKETTRSCKGLVGWQCISRLCLDEKMLGHLLAELASLLSPAHNKHICQASCSVPARLNDSMRGTYDMLCGTITTHRQGGKRHKHCLRILLQPALVPLTLMTERVRRS